MIGPLVARRVLEAPARAELFCFVVRTSFPRAELRLVLLHFSFAQLVLSEGMARSSCGTLQEGHLRQTMFEHTT